MAHRRVKLFSQKTSNKSKKKSKNLELRLGFYITSRKLHKIIKAVVKQNMWLTVLITKLASRELWKNNKQF